MNFDKEIKTPADLEREAGLKMPPKTNDDWRNKYPLNTFKGETRAELERFIEEAVARESLRLARVVIDASMIDEDEINEADFYDVSKTDAFMAGVEHVHKAFRKALIPPTREL